MLCLHEAHDNALAQQKQQQQSNKKCWCHQKMNRYKVSSTKKRIRTENGRRTCSGENHLSKRHCVLQRNKDVNMWILWHLLILKQSKKNKVKFYCRVSFLLKLSVNWWATTTGSTVDKTFFGRPQFSVLSVWMFQSRFFVNFAGDSMKLLFKLEKFRATTHLSSMAYTFITASHLFTWIINLNNLLKWFQNSPDKLKKQSLTHRSTFDRISYTLHFVWKSTHINFISFAFMWIVRF